MRATVISAAAVMVISVALSTKPCSAADPTLSSWIQNTTNQTGQSTVSSINSVVSQILANVQQVRYTAGNVYVNATGIPSYNIGPFGNDPNLPANQNWVYDIPRNPVAQSGTHTATGLGPIGALVNGVPIFNPKDANSYNNQNVWHSNAVVVEAGDMDSALGHPQQSGAYHHHQQPVSLITQLGGDSTHFSPLLGYAFDGYPIYGPYAYANPDGTGGIVRVTSSYEVRNISQRTTLADGTVLSPSQYGPAVSSQYPLGYYVEDYQYVAGSGMLDQYNGRFTVTPDYPQGTYAYFTTTDPLGNSAFPYIVGPQYYGVVSTDNLTHSVSVPAGATTFVPEPAVGAVALSGMVLVALRRRR
jgi:YHYH protein